MLIMALQSKFSCLFATWVLVLALHSMMATAQGQQPQTSTPSPSSCSVPQVFAQCLTNQDTYIRGCTGQDYTCLCKWNTVKLSCWDNCPNEPGREAQNGIMQTYCAISGVAQNVTSSTATRAPASTSLSPTPSASPASASSQGTHAAHNDASSNMDRNRSSFALAGILFLAVVWQTL